MRRNVGDMGGFCCSFLCFVYNKGTTVERVNDHATRNNRGRRQNENGNINTRLVHYGDWHCLHKCIVWFVIRKI